MPPHLVHGFQPLHLVVGASSRLQTPRSSNGSTMIPPSTGGVPRWCSQYTFFEPSALTHLHVMATIVRRWISARRWVYVPPPPLSWISSSFARPCPHEGNKKTQD